MHRKRAIVTANEAVEIDLSPHFLPYHSGMTRPTGRPVGRPKGSGVQTARLELRLRPALLEKVKRAAEEDGVSQAYWLRRAVISSLRWRTRREQD